MNDVQVLVPITERRSWNGGLGNQVNIVYRSHLELSINLNIFRDQLGVYWHVSYIRIALHDTFVHII